MGFRSWRLILLLGFSVLGTSPAAAQDFYNGKTIRVQIFRKAFQATLKDAEFIAEAKKGNFELDPVAGEELERIVNGLFKADPVIVNKLRDLLK